MYKRFTLTTLVCFCFAVAFAQETYRFTKGLVAGPVHQYGREALVKDLLATSCIPDHSRLQLSARRY